MTRRGQSPYALWREWSGLMLCGHTLDAEDLEDEWRYIQRHPTLGSRYPSDLWERTRELSDRLRPAIAELAALYDVDPLSGAMIGSVTPLWLLAGPKNPQRRRADALDAQVRADIDALRALLETVTDADRERAKCDQLVAQDVLTILHSEAEHDEAVRVARLATERARARWREAALPSSVVALSIDERTTLASSLRTVDRALAKLEYWLENEWLDLDEYGIGVDGVVGLVRLRKLVAEARLGVRDAAAHTGIRFRAAGRPKRATPLACPRELGAWTSAERMALLEADVSGGRWLVANLAAVDAMLREMRVLVRSVPLRSEEDREIELHLAELLPVSQGGYEV